MLTFCHVICHRAQDYAEGILKLRATGFAGTTFSFVAYVKKFPYFRDNVLPKLQEAGIR